MSLESYIAAQRSNLESIKTLPHFSILALGMHELYEFSRSIIPRDTHPIFSKFYLLCHKSFLSAVTLIGQCQPEDAAPITRRAVEICRISLALKFNEENWEKWTDFEKRLERWKQREEGKKPSPLYPHIDLPDHPILKRLDPQRGMLSDAWIHFTPEFLNSQNWRDRREIEPPEIKLIYFITDQRMIERELILLVGIHLDFHYLFDECFDKAFTHNPEWQKRVLNISGIGLSLSKDFPKRNRE
jgi:hypothetical protein